MTPESKPLVVLVCGSRGFSDPAPIARELDALPSCSIVVHGACPTGADAIADRLARERRLTVRRYPADWARHGRAAGPKRNGLMLELELPELVLAFTNDLSQSRGTADCVRQARVAGIPVRVIGESE